MKLFRLVNVAHDPVDVGRLLRRPSNHSLQKMGNGMYFAMDPWSALRFKYGSRSGHIYTHIVECEVPFSVSDFYDQRSNSAIARSPFGFAQTAEEKFGGYCRANGFVGTIWTSRIGWTEIVVHEAHVGHGFSITDSELLR